MEKVTLKLDLETAQAIAKGKAAVGEIAGGAGGKGIPPALKQLQDELAKIGRTSATAQNAAKSAYSQEAAMLNLSLQRIRDKRINEREAGRELDLNMRNQVKHWQALQKAGVGHPPINTRMAAMGVMAAPFSPWIAARALSSSGLFNSIGGNGGAGGLFGKLVGPGGFGGFTAAFIAINVAMRALRLGFEELTSAVHRGSQLYLKSAELGTSVGTFSHLSKTFDALGLPQGAAEKLMASGQFMRGQKMTAEGVMIGAGRGILSREEMQAIRNLSADVADLWNKTADAARQSAHAAPALFNESVAIARLRIEWNTMWEQLAQDLYPLINVILDTTTSFLHMANVILELGRIAKDFVASIVFPHTGVKWWDKQMDELRRNIFGTNTDRKTDFQKFGGVAQSPQVNMWQKLGFVVGGFGGVDYARQTAQNTAAIARNTAGMNAGRSGYQFSIPVFTIP